MAHGFKQVDADVSLIRLVQKECERAAIPILRRFIKARSLAEKCRLLASGSPPPQSAGAGGPPTNISPELDGLMDELALVIQHTESYDRLVVSKARQCLPLVSHCIMHARERRTRW